MFDLKDVQIKDEEAEMFLQNTEEVMPRNVISFPAGGKSFACGEQDSGTA